MNSDIIPNNKKTSPESNKSGPQRFWNSLFSPSSALEEIADQRSARLAAIFLFAILFLNLFGRIIVLFRDGISAAFSSDIIFALATSLIAYGFSRTKWFRVSIFIFSLSFSSTAYITILIQGNQANFPSLILSYVPLSLIVASSFLSSWTLLLLTTLNIGLYLSLQYFGITLPGNFIAQTGIMGVIGLILIFLTNFRNKTEEIRLAEIQNTNRELEILSNELEERVEKRTEELTQATGQSDRRSEQLIAIAELARSLTEAQELESLLPAITAFISQRLGYYHAGIFLNDNDNTFAVLRGANSEGGQKMLERGHKLRIGSQGIVGHAIQSRQPRIALDVGDDAVYFDNPDLPETRSEMAVPLRLGDEFIGALDIQSTQENAFTEQDASVFYTLADQIALAVQNARLLSQAQTTLRKTEDAFAEQIGRDWKIFLASKSLSGYHFNGIGAIPLTTTSETNSKFDTDLTLSMRLRGQIIGKLKLKATNRERKWTKSEIAIAEAAIERAALALENARLLEDARRVAAKERIISEGTTRISAALDVESIMQATAKELEQALGGSEVIIHLESEE